eukprot:6399806-Amphidinium_carterae.1
MVHPDQVGSLVLDHGLHMTSARATQALLLVAVRMQSRFYILVDGTMAKMEAVLFADASQQQAGRHGQLWKQMR